MKLHDFLSFRTSLFSVFLLSISSLVKAQSSSTGSLTGVITDTSGAVLGRATVTLVDEDTLTERRLLSLDSGVYVAPLLPPTLYTVRAAHPGFADTIYHHVAVTVTATQTLNIRLVAGTSQTIEVTAETVETQITPTAGSVTGRELVAGLPLAARNYTQILGLNTGVASEVANAGAVGRGDTSYASGPSGFSSFGASTNDNNFQLDGVDVNDLQGSAFFSRGVPVPNPDAIQEFRVVTLPYDASQGRNSGASIDVVGRAGTKALHGSLFEYFRNDALNANTYFRKASGTSRADLKQNQFGGTVSGTLYRSLLGFGSYQETRQTNGLDPSCTSSVSLPPLTNDRSAAALGSLFQGQRGYFQNALGGVGPSIRSDGSNLNPAALALLQRRNADGSYLIPTPQAIVSASGNFDARGISNLSIPCPYVEHQGVVNLDGQVSTKQHVAVRSFASNSSTFSTLPAPRLGGAALPSSGSQITDRFRTLSIAHTWVIRNNLLNEAHFGFNRVRGTIVQRYPFSYSSVGATVPSFDDATPVLTIAGASIGGSGNLLSGAINTFTLQDSAAYSHARHFLRVGGGITRVQDNQPFLHFYGAALFLSFPDFLLGQNAAQNGTAAVCAFAGCGAGYSDIAYAQDTPGLIQREYRVLSDHLFVQDAFRLSSRVTLNLGLRYERLGDLADKLGHNTSFNPALADTSPPASGSLQGYVVPANYTGAVPSGVTRLSNNYGIDGTGQNTWQPRLSFAWQLPGGDHVVLHGGYGLFRSRITGDAYNQSVVTQPFARLRQFQGPTPVAASLSLSQPLPAFGTALPSFSPYCPPTSSACTEAPVFNGLAPDVQPPVVQRYSLDVETRLRPSLVLDVGYVGSHAQKLLTQVFINQAELATSASAIHGVTSNTVANIPFRVPIPGFTVPNLTQFRSSGSSIYNALEASLRYRTSKSREFLVSYTWARDLTDTYSGITGMHGGTILGDQTAPRSAYGSDNFIRPQRLVATFLVHTPAALSGKLRTVLGVWQFSGVVVAQSGHPLTVTYKNQFSAYGITNDRATLRPGCNPASNAVGAARLQSWFSTSCFTTPAVIGSDGVATGFGNAPVGLFQGPKQINVDTSAQRDFRLSEKSNLQFRVDAFNLFNHAEFSDPDIELSSVTFGSIRSTTVNPRILQVALRLWF